MKPEQQNTENDTDDQSEKPQQQVTQITTDLLGTEVYYDNGKPAGQIRGLFLAPTFGRTQGAQTTWAVLLRPDGTFHQSELTYLRTPVGGTGLLGSFPRAIWSGRGEDRVYGPEPLYRVWVRKEGGTGLYPASGRVLRERWRPLGWEITYESGPVVVIDWPATNVLWQPQQTQTQPQAQQQPQGAHSAAAHVSTMPENAMIEIFLYAVGPLTVSACVVATLSRKEIAEKVNALLPTEISTKWSISKDPEFATGEDNPCPCEDHPGRMHYLLHC